MTCLIETPRLRLRYLNAGDLDALHAVVGDRETMRYYPAPFSRGFVMTWIDRNLERYAKHGYGLFGMELKASGEMIGDCGLVWQDVLGTERLEVGYHVRRDHWNHGYATEAARACMDYAFDRVGVDSIISLIRPENLPSRRVAEKNGLRIAERIVWKEFTHDVWEKKSSSVRQ